MAEYSSRELANRWNHRFLDDDRFQDAPPRRLVKDYASFLPESGLALEFAGGMGKTSDFLQRCGLQVIELDISLQALSRARDLNKDACQLTADARFLPLADTHFDVICNFYFLERRLFSDIKRLLLPGGILFFETMLIEMQTIRPEIPDDHLLRPGELKAEFYDWKIIHLFEGWLDSDHGHKKAVGQLVARKPFTPV